MFRIVPKGTPGAIPLREAMDIRLRELGIYFPPESRRKLSLASKRAWMGNSYVGMPEKTSATLQKWWNRTR